MTAKRKPPSKARKAGKRDTLLSPWVLFSRFSLCSLIQLLKFLAHLLGREGRWMTKKQRRRSLVRQVFLVVLSKKEKRRRTDAMPVLSFRLSNAKERASTLPRKLRADARGAPGRLKGPLPEELLLLARRRERTQLRRFSEKKKVKAEAALVVVASKWA